MLRRRIAYIAACAVALVAFVGTNVPLALGALLLLVVLFAGSAVCCSVAASSLELGFEVPPACEVGQPLSLRIAVRRRILVPIGRIECTVSCRNVMMGANRSSLVTLDASAAPQSRYELPLRTDACGRVELAAGDVRVCDPLGLLRRTAEARFSGSYTVYPRMLDLTVPLERSPRATYSGTAYDPRRRGQDMSEPFDIRDYRETDSLHAIHWKLSSKLDKLLVREASHPSNYDVLLLVDAGLRDEDGAPTPANVLTAILELAASISYEFLRQNLGHNVAFSDEGGLADAMVDSPASFDEMLDVLMGTPLPPTFGVDVGAFEWYRRERSFTKTVLITGAMDQRAFVEMGSVTDLSVVHVASAGAKAVEETDAFAITSIPVEDVASGVKSVVI